VIVDDRFRLDGRVALVTGGGTGIGRASALVLANHGADVVLAGRRPEPLEETAALVEASGRRAIVAPADVTVRQQCKSLVDVAIEKFGRLDVLVNNAGGGITKPILDWDDDEWDQVMDLNLASAWFLSRYAVQPMIVQGRGAIVNISSAAGLGPIPMAAIYGAAKAGLNNLTASMAGAWTGEGVRVNCIACGAIRTPGLQHVADNAGFDIDMLGQSNALGRLADPNEIGFGVLFFASDASSFCSGQTLYMGGGPRSVG
jgi:NAD(P)-dependent dehydrogenase (short-subunit alcohol dehydrogenase family)